MYGSLMGQQDNAKEKLQWKAASFGTAGQTFLTYQEMAGVANMLN